MNTVLLATDGSPTAAQALDFAIEVCQDTGARLEVLTVRTLGAHGDPRRRSAITWICSLWSRRSRRRPRDMHTTWESRPQHARRMAPRRR